MAKILLKSNEEIELIKISSLIVSGALAEVAKWVKPGVTSKKLDAIAEAYIRDHGAEPAFLGYPGAHGSFPATLCMSPNNQVVHGIPNEEEFKEGDIISVDCGAKKNGYFGDSAYTFAIGEVSLEAKKILEVTKESLYRGIEQAIVGNRIGDIGYAVQSYVEQHGFSVVRDLVGHGVGKNLHEKPEVPNYGKRSNGIKLEHGMVIAIEPMVNEGDYRVKFWNDGWTVTTKDGKLSAHFEHTVAIVKEGVQILSSFDEIEKNINK